MTRMAHLVTALPDLFELLIGWYDSPLTDLLAIQVLASIGNSNIKALRVRSSSPVLLQETLLSSNKVKPLHTLFLYHDTSQVSACSHSILHGLYFQMTTKVALSEKQAPFQPRVSCGLTVVHNRVYPPLCKPVLIIRGEFRGALGAEASPSVKTQFFKSY